MSEEALKRIKRKRQARKRKWQAPLKNRVLDWKRRKRSDLTHSQRWIWETRCLRYRVEEITIQLALDSNPYPTYYLAIYDNGVIKEHRKRSAAMDTCERHVQGLLK
jgi:hypothetical protein